MFDRLVGNTSIKSMLRRLLEKGRLPHSLLLSGDDGIGKREFAIELARSLVCTDKQGVEGCGVCSACTRAASFTFPKPDDRDSFKTVIFSEHLDVGTVVPYNRSILVDAVRSVESEANYRPSEAQARVFIIDDADKMNDAASNALLKTLEEPPASSYIFLVTSRPDALLRTIRSRCQTLRLAPVSTTEIERFLIEERAFQHHEATIAARLSRGSIGRAVRLDVKRVQTDRERMLSVIEQALQHGIASLLRISEEMNDAKNKDLFEDNLDMLQSLIHDVWSLKAGTLPDDLVHTDIGDALERLAAKASAPQLAEWMSSIARLRDTLIVNINRRVATDALFVSMAA